MKEDRGKEEGKERGIGCVDENGNEDENRGGDGDGDCNV